MVANPTHGIAGEESDDFGEDDEVEMAFADI